MNSKLDVYLNSDLVGSLSLNSNDEMNFKYIPNATRSISVAMPLNQAEYENRHCEAFFGGLLPEGDGAKKALGQRFGLSPENTFSLLRAIGAECAGAISILKTGSSVPIEQTGEIKILSEGELAKHIRELPQRPLFVGVNGIRLSLSGVQDKAAVSLTPEGIGIPSGGPTTYILKPDIQRTSGVIYCEHLCMKTAHRLGISTASVKLARAEDQVYLLVKRFDRELGTNLHELKRVHQEDFCQALAIPPKRKYQEDGGPSLKDCFQLLNKSSFPGRERLNLLTAVIFNLLISNMDAHGKNFSLLHSSKGIRLAPLYDLICTAAFPEYSQTLAMEIGDCNKPHELCAFQWKLLCEDIEYGYKAFKKTALNLCKFLPSAAEKEYAIMVEAGWSHQACELAIGAITANCAEMKSHLNI